MAPRYVILALFATMLAIGVPLFVAKRLQLGGFAKSPQTVTISLGGTALIAGGRAELWYGGETFEVSCVGDRKRSSQDEPCTACRTTVTLKSIDQNGPVPRATFVVSWNP